MTLRHGTRRTKAADFTFELDTAGSSSEGQLPRINRSLDSDWVMSCGLDFQDNRIVLTDVRVSPASVVPRGGITARVLKKITLGGLLQRVNDQWRSEAKDDLLALFATPRSVAGPAAQGRSGNRGRPPHSDVVYAELARDYVRSLGERGAAPIIEKLAKQHRLSIAATRTRISEARRRGLLTGGVRGLPGGTLTPKAEELLAK